MLEENRKIANFSLYIEKLSQLLKLPLLAGAILKRCKQNCYEKLLSDLLVKW